MVTTKLDLQNPSTAMFLGDEARKNYEKFITNINDCTNNWPSVSVLLLRKVRVVLTCTTMTRLKMLSVRG